MTVPSVHVIVLNWNGLADTLECLDSLACQDYAALRVHVVDNGSAESEADTIERLHPSVKVLRQGRNLGFCAGNNVGIKQALAEGADYVLILNNDTIVPENLISELVRRSATLTDAGAVSPLIMHYPERERVWFAGSVWESETAGFRHLYAGRTLDELELHEPYPTAYACGCCLLVRSEVLRRVGLMDERYFAYYDEADWCSRMQEAGLQCYVIPSASLYHKVSRSTPSLIATYLMARNRLLWMREHLSLRERSRSYQYLFKEALWNLCNMGGLFRRERELTTVQSKAMLLAWRDFLYGRFGSWPKRIDQLRS
jgi:GT2 family glycosyltransferase